MSPDHLMHQSNPDGPQRPVVALAGGKSGGHVFPALAVAEELRALGAEVVLFGMADGMERRLAEERGIDFEGIDAAALVGTRLGAKIASLTTLVLNSWKARGALRRRRAVAVLGTGGFVSAPTVLGARLAGCPVVLLEPNAEPGAANRLLSRFARLATVAFEETGEQLRCPTLVTGVPVRSAFFAVGPLQPRTPRRLLVVGGSQGAVRLNRELPGRLAEALAQGDTPMEGRVLHQCGRGNLEDTATAWRRALGVAAVEEGEALTLEARGLEIRLREFLDDMPAALDGADLVVSRAGAITLAELCAAGRPAILVPLPLAGAHQLANARHQERCGAAVVVEQVDLETIGAEIRRLLAEETVLVEMGAAARRLAREGAGRAVAEATRDVARREGRWAA